jgi:hypothetical protein
MSKTADLERELAELHSKYKGGDGERESVKVIKKQRATIDKLKKDNDRLRQDLDLDSSMRSSLARSKTPVDATTNMSAALSKLHDNAEQYTRKIEQEKRRIEELDANIKDLNAVVLEQRKKLGGSNAVRENNTRTQKQIQVQPLAFMPPACAFPNGRNASDHSCLLFSHAKAQRHTPCGKLCTAHHLMGQIVDDAYCRVRFLRTGWTSRFSNSTRHSHTTSSSARVSIRCGASGRASTASIRSWTRILQKRRTRCSALLTFRMLRTAPAAKAFSIA